MCPGSMCVGPLCAARMQQPACDAIAVNAGYSQTNWTSLDADCQWDLPIDYEMHETMEYEPASLPIGETRQIDYEEELAIDEATENELDARNDRLEAEAFAVAEALAIALVEDDSYVIEGSAELDKLNGSGGPEYVEVEVENLR